METKGWKENITSFGIGVAANLATSQIDTMKPITTYQSKQQSPHINQNINLPQERIITVPIERSNGGESRI